MTDEYGMCSGCLVLFGATQHSCTAMRMGWRRYVDDWWLLRERSVDFHPTWFEA